MSIYKSFRYQIPELPAKLVRLGLMICDRFGDPICPLPEVFLSERLKNQFMNNSRFCENRVSGILLRKELDLIFLAQDFYHRFVDLLDTDTIEIRFIVPKKDPENRFKIDKKAWPWYLAEAFNSLPNYTRKMFVNFNFPSILKDTVKSTHFHEGYTFECDVCAGPVNVFFEEGIRLPLVLNNPDDWDLNSYDYNTKNQLAAGTTALIAWFSMSKIDRLRIESPLLFHQFYIEMCKISLQKGFGGIIKGLLYDKNFRHELREIIWIFDKTVFKN